MNISIYLNIFLYKFGGTEGYTANLIEVLQNLYPDSEITIITENYNRKAKVNVANFIKIQNEAYGLKINPDKISLKLINTKELKVNEKASKITRTLQFIIRQNNFFRTQRIINHITKNHDLFINCSRYSFYGNSSKNYAIIHFPKNRLSEIPINKKIPVLKYMTLKHDKKYVSNTDLFFSNSNFTSYWLSQYWNIPAEKKVVLYPPVTEVTKTAGKKKNQILICSRINSSKKIHVLIKAFLNSEALRENCNLIIAGSIKGEDTAYIKMLEEYSFRIKLYYEPSREKLEQLYAESDIFWHAKGIDEEDPLYFEHFGITTVEAMNAGCIPVVIDKGGQKEIVDDTCGFRWNDIDELVKSTEKLINNYPGKEKLRENSRKKSKQFLKDQFEKKLKELLTRSFS